MTTYNQAKAAAELAAYSPDGSETVGFTGRDGEDYGAAFSAMVSATMPTELITLGPKGKVSSMAEALALRNTYTPQLLATVVASVTGTSSGTVIQLFADVESGDDLTPLVGQTVYVRIGGTGPLIKMFVVTATRILAQYPFYADLTSVQFELFRIRPAVIQVLPGHRETLTSKLLIPSFTTLFSYGKGSSEIATTIDGGFNVTDTVGINLIGMSTEQTHGTSGFGSTIDITNTDMKSAMCDQVSLLNCTMSGGPLDLILADNKTGTFSVENCSLDGIWDILRLGACARINIRNNPLIRSQAFDDFTSASAAAIAFSATAGGAAYPDRQLSIVNNILHSESFHSSPGNSISGITCETVYAYKSMSIANNLIKTIAHAGTFAVHGVQIGSLASSELDLSSNLFDCVNDDVGTDPWHVFIAATPNAITKSDGNNRTVNDVPFRVNDPLTTNYSPYANKG